MIIGAILLTTYAAYLHVQVRKLRSNVKELESAVDMLDSNLYAAQDSIQIMADTINSANNVIPTRKALTMHGSKE